MSHSSLAEVDQSTRTPVRRRVSYTQLFWLLIGIPILLEALSFWIVNLPTFKKHADFYWVAAQSSLFDDAGKACDILIYGDSTGMAGLDPSFIQKTTGLSTCNISVSIPTLDLVGMDPLNRYLARNPRPRFLILQFSAKNFHAFPYNTGHAEAMDGFVLVMRHYGWKHMLPEFIRHPDYLLMVPQYVYVDGLEQAVRSMLDDKRLTETSGSYIILRRSHASPCIAVGTYLAPDAAWVRSLRTTYGQKAEHVLVNVAPVSSCSPDASIWKEGFAGVSDNALAGYPDSMRADDNGHLNREGALRFSRESAAQLMRLDAPAQQLKHISHP